MEFNFEKDKKSLESEKVVEKLWGGEIWITNNELYCQKFLYIHKGWRFSLQYHQKKHETFHLLNGMIYLELQKNLVVPKLNYINKDRILKPGSTQIIERFQVHGASALTDSVILETSTHHEDTDTYRIRDGGQFELAQLITDLRTKKIL